jgi:hypothetical protein
MIRIDTKLKVSKASIRNSDQPDRVSLSLAYTYAGGEEEVVSLKRTARWLYALGKTPLAQALAQLAEDLEMGITLGAVSPGDTLYHTVTV